MSSNNPPPTPAVNCVIDRQLLNSKTYKAFRENVGLSLFAPLCGKNRGAIVLQPPDGGTYGCVQLPPDVCARAGVNTTAHIPDTNSIDQAFVNKTITAADAVDLLDLFVQSVYVSSGPGVAKDVHGCGVNGLTTLTCDQKKTLAPETIRAATLAGVLAPAPWATGGSALTLEQAESFYTAQDFADMSKLGLNAVQIPVLVSVFDGSRHNQKLLNLLDGLIDMAAAEHMGVLLVLERDVTAAADKHSAETEVDAVQAAATYAASQKSVLGLTLPSPELISAARAGSTTLPLLIKAGEFDLAFLPLSQDPHVYIALDRDHITSVADIASSDSPMDRSKLFYHESVACQGRGPMEYAECYKNMPAYVVSGFNGAIDDCIHREDVSRFRDYGQCGRLHERIESPWWHAHQQSYLARQLAAFETGAGWTFDAWKLYNDNDDKKVGILDEHAKLFALKNVAAAGLFPSLVTSSSKKEEEAVSSQQLLAACLNPPVPDFVLGDDTLAPTPGPPPDCGNGWWNATTEKCDYWIPPPEPTPCPTVAPMSECPAALSSSSRVLIVAAVVGGAVALLLRALVVKCCGGRQREAGYTAVPNAGINV